MIIDQQQACITFINPHRCKRENQDKLVAVLLEGINTIYRHAPGFISAAIHKSDDGTRVTNYAQYRNLEALHSAWNNPAIPGFAKRVGALIEEDDPQTYQVVSVIGSAEKPC